MGWIDRQRAEWLASEDADEYFERLAEARDGYGPDAAPEPVCGHRPAGSCGVTCQQPAGHAGSHGDQHESWPRDEQDEGEAAGGWSDEDPAEAWYGEGDAGRGARQTTGEHLRPAPAAAAEPDDDLPF